MKSMADTPAVQLLSVSKHYGERNSGSPSAARVVFEDVSWELAEGETAVIHGESGVGKSTLLNLIAGLDRPSAGEIRLAGQSLTALGDADLARLRNRLLGIVFQDYHLESRLSAVENVILPLLLRDESLSTAREKARATLAELGLAEFADQSVALLSGGQCQRVAVARALVTRPRLLLADEPTANLDEQTARMILDRLERYQAEENASLILISHDPRALCHPGWRTVRCADKRLVEEN
jgi:lipoprotein-releasing system ATP-binding protein